MKKVIKLLLFSVLFLSLHFVVAQNTITGVVSDNEGLPLPGATIVVEGTTTGVTTDFDGNFSINAEEGDTLNISYVGYQSQSIVVDNQDTISISLKQGTELEEVVIIGYGTQKKTSLTGSVSYAKGEDLAKATSPNITQSLAGRISGVSMRPNGGEPGNDNPDIHIRGIVTTGNNAPLIVIDGIRRDNMSQIDPNTIETVTILKDAAAVAPFGMGGANGVILITTKRGKLGKPVVKLSSSYGIQNPTYLPDMLNAQDYMTLANEGYLNVNPNGTTPPYGTDLVTNYATKHQEDPYRYPDSNFLGLFSENIPVLSNNMEISGGTETVRYVGGMGHYKQEGLFESLGYGRYNYNLGLDVQVTPTTKISMSLYGSIDDTDGLDADESVTHLMRSMYLFTPNRTILYPEGDKWGQSSGVTPVGVLRSDGYRKDEDNTLLSSVSIEQELPFIEGLSIKGVFGYDAGQSNNKLWHKPFVYHNINLSQTPYTYNEVVSLHENTGKPDTWLQLENYRSKKFTYQGYLNYNRNFGDHDISALVVAEATNTKSAFFSTRRNNFAIEIDELSLGSSNKLDYDNSGSSGTGSEIGYVYRLGYTYKSKYIFEAAGRYDGHYSFGPEDRWGYFPSFSAAWRISEEDFMKNIGLIDRLKLRSSWGKSGNLPYINGQLADFQYLSGYDLRGNAHAFGNGSLVQGSSVQTEANPYISWEIATKFNIGFDLGMLDGLLNIEFDYFHEDRTRMLLSPQVTLPVEYGLSLSQENKGEMDNNGFEFTIGSHKELSNGLIMAFTANMSHAENNMLEVFQTDAEKNNPNRTRVGRPLGTHYGYKSLGLFSMSDDTNNDGLINGDDGYNVTQFGDLHPGDIKYADLSGPDGVPDGKIDSNDETVIGNPVYPNTTYGFTSSFDYKGFNLSLFFQGAANNSINTYQFMTVPFENTGSNTSYEFFNNHWTPGDQNARYPRTTQSPYSNNIQTSDFWMVDTGYIRLKTAILGYTIPENITKKLSLSSIGLYVTGQNLFTFSLLDYIDPELGYNSRETAYPVMKSVSFGIDITF